MLHLNVVFGGAEKQLSIVVLPVPNIPTSCKCVSASLCDPKGVNTFGEGSIDPRYIGFHAHYVTIMIKDQRPNPNKNIACAPYAGVDYNLTLCPLQSRLHGQSYAIVDPNPMPESTLFPK
jgi:hypothetical protein